MDATVTVTRLIDVLMARLPEGGHELILIDVNRNTDMEELLKHDPKEELSKHLRNAGQDFALTVITNVADDSRKVLARHRDPGSSQPRDNALDLEWPADLFSLGHLAIPFRRDDPLYGIVFDPASNHVQIGCAALRGERGVLSISASEMLRIRFNPFYSYVERRILERTRMQD